MRRLPTLGAGMTRFVGLATACGGSGRSQQRPTASTPEPAGGQATAPDGEPVAVEHAMDTTEVTCA